VERHAPLDRERPWSCRGPYARRSRRCGVGGRSSHGGASLVGRHRGRRGGDGERQRDGARVRRARTTGARGLAGARRALAAVRRRVARPAIGGPAAPAALRRPVRGAQRLAWRGDDRARWSPLPLPTTRRGRSLVLSGRRQRHRRGSDYPDAIVQIAMLAGAARSGDFIMSATPGFDFRRRYEPIPHRSAHGALHRDHMLVPLLVNRPPARTPRRTTDLFASTLDALHIPAPATLDGESFL